MALIQRSLFLRPIFTPRALSSLHVSVLQQKRALSEYSTDSLPMENSSRANVELVKKVFDLVCREGLISDNYDSDKKVVEFVPPAELGERLGGLNIEPEGTKDVDSLIEAVAKYSVKTCHENFHNQLYAGSDAAGLAGQVRIYYLRFKNSPLKRKIKFLPTTCNYMHIAQCSGEKTNFLKRL